MPFTISIFGGPKKPGSCKVSNLDGHKSLYSDAFYAADEFAALYGGETYATVKKAYDPDSRFLDLYAKAVRRQ